MCVYVHTQVHICTLRLNRFSGKWFITAPAGEHTLVLKYSIISPFLTPTPIPNLKAQLYTRSFRNHTILVSGANEPILALSLSVGSAFCAKEMRVII